MIQFSGAPIAVEFRPCLKAVGGQLRCGGERGTEVHAGSFLRERRIVLDSALLRDKGECDRILTHEIFHFVWWKLGRRRRLEYESWIAREMRERVAGEMGWSAEWRKANLQPVDWKEQTRRWREYLSESFCDTAAAHLLRLKDHAEITLAKPARRLRWNGLEELLDWDRLSI